jgi:hypothetical protein
MEVPDGDVGDLAKGMINKHPIDALDWAALISNMLFLLGHAEKSKSGYWYEPPLRGSKLGSDSEEIQHGRIA